MSRARSALGAVLVLGLAAAPPAAATTVGPLGASHPEAVLRVQGHATQANQTTVRSVAGSRRSVRVSERRTGMTAHPDAGPLSPYFRCLVVLNDATCGLSDQRPFLVYGFFGSGDDVVDATGLAPTTGPDHWNLGSGDDRFTGAGGDDHVAPGRGDDVVLGAISVAYDDIAGGARVSLDGVANDGERGTGQIAPSVWWVRGSPGDDELSGNDGEQQLSGGDGGIDRIAGLGGDDRLDAHGGRIDGGDGDDEILGIAKAGPITVDAGAGADAVRIGFTPELHPGTFALGPGDDTIRLGRAYAAEAPVTISCGDGHDRITEFAGGAVTIAADCEEIVPAS